MFSSQSRILYCILLWNLDHYNVLIRNTYILARMQYASGNYKMYCKYFGD
jgi:hypothetical protein